MKLHNGFKLLISILIAMFAGVLGSLATAPAISGWYAGLTKPAVTPPNEVFGPVWSALYLLMGISLYLAWKHDWKIVNPILEKRKRAWNHWSERLWFGDWKTINVVVIFIIQYVVNILWSYTFFGVHAIVFAFFEILVLWIAIVYLIMNFYRISKAAAYLLIPYLLWVSFAAYLNYLILTLNA